MEQKYEITGEETEKELGETNEIVDSFFDSCSSWQCRKCGMGSQGSGYHRCPGCITKTVCEYCRNYSDGRCRLSRHQ